MTFKKKTGSAKFIRIDDWHEHCSGLAEIDRPVVLRIDQHSGVVKIRPKTNAEIVAIQKRMIADSIRQGSFATMASPGALRP